MKRAPRTGPCLCLLLLIASKRRTSRFQKKPLTEYTQFLWHQCSQLPCSSCFSMSKTDHPIEHWRWILNTIKANKVITLRCFFLPFCSFFSLFNSFPRVSNIVQAISRRLMGHDNTFKRIPLPADSEEFKNVETLFHKTVLKSKAKITMIEKIKNAFSNERYERYSKCINKT